MDLIIWLNVRNLCLSLCLSFTLAWDKADPLQIDEFVYLNISKGLLRGFSTRTESNAKPVYVFKSIPFANPPLGELRFAPLTSSRRWQGERDATQYAAACMSNSSRTTSPQAPIDEDCLYANVFTSQACVKGVKKGICPTLFYIHGGNFVYDSAVMFNDRQIVEKYVSHDIIFVICAYRLGVFGFLDIGTDDVIPRNLGLYDLLFALKWYHSEIHSFGGSPQHITVMGNSGGASVIEYLMLIRGFESDKFFSQAILSSPRPKFKHHLNVEVTRQLLIEFKCIRSDITNILMLNEKERRAAAECMRRVDARRLINAQAAAETRGFQFEGISANADLPAEYFFELFPQMRPTRLLITTTFWEFAEAKKLQSVISDCNDFADYFGYRTREVHQACSHLYNDPNIPRYVGAEGVHAEANLFAIENTRRDGVTFRGSFQLANHSKHADDLLYFFGLHWMRNATVTPAEKLMDLYYPYMIRNFLHYGWADKAWKKVCRDGSDYFILNFEVTNGKVTDWPRMEHGYIDSPANRFWLRDAAFIDRQSNRLRRSIEKNWAYFNTLTTMNVLSSYLRANWLGNENQNYNIENRWNDVKNSKRFVKNELNSFLKNSYPTLFVQNLESIDSNQETPSILIPSSDVEDKLLWTSGSVLGVVSVCAIAAFILGIILLCANKRKNAWYSWCSRSLERSPLLDSNKSKRKL